MFDERRAERDRSVGETEAVRITAEGLGEAIQAKRAEEAMQGIGS